jgi:wobble nucleotide-excising tRNase
LELICDHEITAVYNAINKSNDEIVEKFSINVDIDKKEIDFLINMKGLPDKRPALNILSTAHIRCLGFALLIARIKIKVKKIGFLIIDDPIYSIDHEHRYNLIQYLKKLSESYQLIITSSDRLFSDLIRNSFEDNIFMFYKTKVTKSDGVIYFKLRDKSRYRNYIREAEEHLKSKDFRAASLYARLSLETRIFDLAKKMKIMIPYDQIEKHSMRDIMQYDLKDSLIKAYPIRETEIKTEFDELTKPGYFKTLLGVD